MATETENAPQLGETDGDDSPAIDPRRAAIKTASDLGKGDAKGDLTAEAAKDALEFFLSDEEIPMTKALDVNVGTPDNPKKVLWTIRAIDQETIKNARKLSEEGGRAQRRRSQQAGVVPEIDTANANARIVVAGTLDPDLRHAASMKMSQHDVRERHPDADVPAVMLLQHRLRHKPGLIEQIAGEILGLSGYDDDDIQEHSAGKL